MFFSKEINRHRNVKHLLLRKTDVLKTCRKGKFLGKKIWRNALALKGKKVQGIFGETFILVLLSSTAIFCLQNRVSIYLNLFCSEKKVDFRDIMDVSPDILAKNLNFEKLRHFFIYEKALITTTSISSYHWKTLIPFCLRKKKLENAFLTLILNHRKIVQKKKFMPSKTTINWLFNDMWCYLFIARFDWKIGVSQQTAVRVYYILKLFE